MSTSEMEEFLTEMADVKPMAKSDTRSSLHKPMSPTEAQLARRQSAQAEQTSQGKGLSDHGLVLIAPEDPIEFVRPGVQHGVYKNLRLGKYQLDARLDLHGHSVNEAKQALLQFIEDCQRIEVRCALVLHGKGLHTTPFKGLLKSHVAHWLPQIPQVLAFHSAQKQHGGTGAIYLLLKKSEREKSENRERHQKR